MRAVPFEYCCGASLVVGMNAVLMDPKTKVWGPDHKTFQEQLKQIDNITKGNSFKFSVLTRQQHDNHHEDMIKNGWECIGVGINAVHDSQLFAYIKVRDQEYNRKNLEIVAQKKIPESPPILPTIPVLPTIKKPIPVQRGLPSNIKRDNLGRFSKVVRK